MTVKRQVASMDLTDDEFLDQFESLNFPVEAFHHAQHVRLAWIYLSRYPLVDSLQRFTASLRAFVKKHGAEAKYHETITWCFVLLIHERKQRQASKDWRQFKADNPELFGDILSRYYSQETLRSDFARAHFVMPDRGLVNNPLSKTGV